MPCYKPLVAWLKDAPNPSGKCSLTWDIHKTAHPEQVVSVPCCQMGMYVDINSQSLLITTLRY